MQRVINTVEKNLAPYPASAVTVNGSVSTIIIASPLLNVPLTDEIQSITLQNVGNNNAYIAFGQDADNVTNYHKVITPGQELSVPLVCQVNCFAVGGTIIAPCIIVRKGL